MASTQGNAGINDKLRELQGSDPVLGPFFRTLNTFAMRTIEEFYYDSPDMEVPILSLDKDLRSRRACLILKDGSMLTNRINLNPFVLKTGVEAAEYLAHEIVHVWQVHVGRPCVRNFHGKEFHQRMRRYGIMTTGKGGRHTGYIDDTWEQWMMENSDLDFGAVLPGADKKPLRQLIKHECPGCGATFRSRRALSAICGNCEISFEIPTANLEGLYNEGTAKPKG